MTTVKTVNTNEDDADNSSGLRFDVEVIEQYRVNGVIYSDLRSAEITSLILRIEDRIAKARELCEEEVGFDPDLRVHFDGIKRDFFALIKRYDQGDQAGVETQSVTPDADSNRPIKTRDDEAVDRFASMMKTRMRDMAAKGKSGWDDLNRLDKTLPLRKALLRNAGKRNFRPVDAIDVGNYAMMLWNRATWP